MLHYLKKKKFKQNHKNGFIFLKAESGTGSLLLAGIEFIYTWKYNNRCSDCDV